MADKKEIAEIIAVLSAAYPRFVLTEQTVTTYYMFLRDLEAEVLKIAAQRCATTQEFFPTVYELRRAVAETLREIQHLPSTYEAWEEVISFPKDGFLRKVINDNGSFIIEKCRVMWSHPMIEKVAHQMGWPDFPDEERLSTDRAHFFRAYEYALDAAMLDCVQLPEIRSYIERHESSPDALKIQAGIEKITNQWSKK